MDENTDDCVELLSPEDQETIRNALLEMAGVVRCKDCVFYAHDSVSDYCELHDSAIGTVDNVSMANGFCSWALPKNRKRRQIPEALRLIFDANHKEAANS